MTAPSTAAAPLERDVAATAALAAYSLAVAFGFSRVFSGWDFFFDMAVLVIVGHGASFALRRLRVAGWLAIPVTTALVGWALLVQHYRAAMTWLIPHSGTWDVFARDVGLVRRQFRTAVAPVLYDQVGWAVLAGVSLAVTIVMADAFAFRADARGEALVPGGVLFIFISALSSARYRLLSTIVLVSAGVLVVVALRALHDRRRRVELTAARGPRSLTVPAALGTALALGLLAGLVGPRIPGADADPLYDTRTGGSSGSSEILNPLVDIRSRLTNRSNVELFIIDADQPAYWRSMTLAEFDGTTFTEPPRQVRELGDPALRGNLNRQQIQIRALGGELIPGAADVVSGDLSSGGQTFPIQQLSGTGAVTAAPTRALQPGDVIRLESVTATPTPAELQAATVANPPDPIYLELPDDLPAIVEQSARVVTADATTPYQQALALEAWMQGFDYSLEVQSGHSRSAIETFLELQVGYCEQFSATFAAMARTLGIPSRVAVGFTWGVPSARPDDAGFLSVRGKNAHAWPELWFDGIGWVAFEPTPGRGIPGAGYSTVEPQQDDSPPETVGGVLPDTAPLPTTPPTLTPPTTLATDPTASSIPSDQIPDLLPDGGVDVPSAEAPAETGSSPPWRTIIVVSLLLAALVTPAVVRRWRARSARHHGPVERVEAAWTRACSAAERAGVHSRPSMTTQEWAAATAAELPVAARPMRELAEIVDRIEFAPPDTVDLARPGSLGSTLGDDCDAWALQVSRIAGDTLTAPQRVKRYFTSWN